MRRINSQRRSAMLPLAARACERTLNAHFPLRAATCTQVNPRWRANLSVLKRMRGVNPDV